MRQVYGVRKSFIAVCGMLYDLVECGICVGWLQLIEMSYGTYCCLLQYQWNIEKEKKLRIYNA